jgi:hypothetical protein
VSSQCICRGLRILQKILIDENLSPSLELLAHERGFQCSHVNYLGRGGYKDWQLKSTILDGDWTFVTNNSIDFRGPVSKPGSTGEYDKPRCRGLFWTKYRLPN